jgi:DeoR/GlpR family transcriptional regulator of sugar metabolism
MLTMERRERLKTIFLQQKNVSVSDMAKEFNVSTETIRRDFNYLSEIGFITKTYGGATLKYRANSFVTRQEKAGILVENKRLMAKYAAKLIQPNDCIFLDNSTTVFEMCQELENIPLTVITNSLSVINRLAGVSTINLISPGGNYKAFEQGFFGLETVRFLQRHHLDKAFISCRSIDMKRGMTDSDEMVSELRRNIINSADYTYLLVDHTKFNKSAFLSTSDLGDIYTLITDKKIDAEWKEYLKEKNVKVHVCDEGN